MVSATQAVALAVWVQQFTQASEKLKQAAATAAATAWLTFDDWYNRDPVERLAAEMAQTSLTAQQAAAGISTAYVGNITGTLTTVRVPAAPRRVHTPVRNGADLNLIHTRPAKAYRQAIALGKSHQQALAIAGKRAEGLMLSDITLEDRLAQQRMLDAMGIVTFRRIIRPELSISGTCGLCVAASQRTYKTGDLMPLHPPTCKCIVMPIIGDQDPGLVLNEEDIGQLRDDAGSNKAADLKRTRYTVQEHGELGPVLTKVGDEFRDQQRVALENDPARARRMLDAALPVLQEFENRADSGERHAEERLAFQRELVAKLERITGSAAA